MIKLSNIHFGNRVKVRRRMLGLTQKELAKKINVSAQQVQKYETGENRMSATMIFQIAQALELDITFFFEYPNMDIYKRLDDSEVWKFAEEFSKLHCKKVKRGLISFIKNLQGI